MDIAVVGASYVGLVAAACFADSGHDVVCIDSAAEKIDALQQGRLPIYEPDLQPLVARNLANGRLSFTCDLARAVCHGKIIFVAVGSPGNEQGGADLADILAVADGIGRLIEGYRVVVDKSTVPVGTAERVAAVIAARLQERGVAVECDVVSNPEFLREGSAVADFSHPDRVVVGSDSERATALLREIYAPFLREPRQLLQMSVHSAELAKYAANAMLATRISFMNQMARLCEHFDADINDVRAVLGSDLRIGSAFLAAGLGYGGSCLPKDVKALVRSATAVGCDVPLLQAVDAVNEAQKRVLGERMLAALDDGGGAAGKIVAVWGVAFKPGTDDLREAPALILIEQLLAAGAQVRVYDPVALPNARRLLGERVAFCSSAAEALLQADALAIATEWEEFSRYEPELIAHALRQPLVFDGRNLFEPARMAAAGLHYYSIGRPYVPALKAVAER